MIDPPCEVFSRGYAAAGARWDSRADSRQYRLVLPEQSGRSDYSHAALWNPRRGLSKMSLKVRISKSRDSSDNQFQ
jgi:hypothetical protein